MLLASELKERFKCTMMNPRDLDYTPWSACNCNKKYVVYTIFSKLKIIPVAASTYLRSYGEELGLNMDGNSIFSFQCGICVLLKIWTTPNKLYGSISILFLHFTLVVSENAAEKMTEFEILGWTYPLKSNLSSDANIHTYRRSQKSHSKKLKSNLITYNLMYDSTESLHL